NWPTSEQPVPQRAPETAAEFFERGVQLLHANRSAEAMPFLMDAVKRSDDPAYKVMAAYGFILNAQHRPAVEMSRQAIAQGAASAVVLNNLGHSLIQSNLYPEAI